MSNGSASGHSRTGESADSDGCGKPSHKSNYDMFTFMLLARTWPSSPGPALSSLAVVSWPFGVVVTPCPSSTAPADVQHETDIKLARHFDPITLGHGLRARAARIASLMSSKVRRALPPVCTDTPRSSSFDTLRRSHLPVLVRSPGCREWSSSSDRAPNCPFLRSLWLPVRPPTSTSPRENPWCGATLRHGCTG